jgi:DNA-binding response OmpR family regulator
MRLLLIEQEPGSRAFLARAFEAEGYEVDAAASVSEAVSKALATPHDLAIIDVPPAEVDGPGVLPELQRLRPELRVMVISARNDLPTKLRMFELGAVDVLDKPFVLDELIARARVQMRAIHGTTGVVLSAGGLVLDPARREARYRDVVATLSDREFRLLHFLMLHPGEVISRQRLLAEVWGYDFDPRSNVVDVCIRRLRRLLGPDAPIETVRKAGYRAAA